MNKIEQKIRAVIETEVCFRKSAEVKHRILLNTVQKTSFELKLINTLSTVRLSVNKRVLMKEKLVMFIEASRKGIFEQLFNNQFLKRSLASFSLLAFLFGLVLQPFSEIETVKAYTPTKVATFSGNVTVERNGELLRVTNDFLLSENDILQTGPAGFAEVVFSDDTVSRLSSSTRVYFSKLDNKVVNSNVEIALKSGEVWVNTLGLSGAMSSFVVNAREVSTTVRTASVFDIESNQDFVRVVALENNLNLELLHRGEYLPTSLKKGQLVKVRSETPVDTYLNQVNFEEKLSDLNVEWILSNYKQDEFYRNTLSENRLIDLRKKAGITADSYFYPVKEFQRAARLAVTFNPIRQAELQLYFANQKLLEAEVLFDKGDTETAKKTLNEYSENLVKVAKKVSNLNVDSNTKKEDVQRLKDNLVASVAVPKRAVSDVLPNDEKYEFKQVLNSAEIIIADTEIDKKIIELSQLSQILNEAKLLVANNEQALAEEKLNKYLLEIERIGLEFTALSDEDKALVALAIIESNLDGIEALESIKEKPAVQQQEGAVVVTEPIVSSPVTASEPVVNSDTVNVTPAVAPVQTVDKSADFSTKLEAVKEVTKENLNLSIEAANQVKTPTLLNELNKISSQVDLSVTSAGSTNITVTDINIVTTTSKTLSPKN